jgi:hypothetical protein
MWPDNETDIDLLGFEYLVDQLEVLLTNEACCRSRSSCRAIGVRQE